MKLLHASTKEAQGGLQRFYTNGHQFQPQHILQIRDLYSILYPHRRGKKPTMPLRFGTPAGAYSFVAGGVTSVLRASSSKLRVGHCPWTSCKSPFSTQLYSPIARQEPWPREHIVLWPALLKRICRGRSTSLRTICLLLLPG